MSGSSNDPKAERPIGVDDYVGRVGHEKHYLHKTHFDSPGLREKMYDFSQDPDYVQVSPGKWKKKEKDNGS